MNTTPLKVPCSIEPVARPSAWRGWACLAPPMAIAVALAAAAAGVWAQGPWLMAGVSDPAAHRTASFASALALQARCANAMVQGTCRAMQVSPSTAVPSSRVFVAGAGEVDATVYEQLRRQGDAMCGEVQRLCDQDWDSTACRIARALYPETD